MLSHDEFAKNMTMAARRGDDLFEVLSLTADHLLHCQICQANITEIVEAILVEEELKEESEIDPADLSQEEIEPLLQFPSFDLSFLSGVRSSPATPKQRTEQGLVRDLIAGLSNAGSIDGSKESKPVVETILPVKEIAHPSETRSSDKFDVPQVPAKEEVVSAQPANLPAARLSKEGMASSAASLLIADARALEESGNLAEAQATYTIARTQVRSDDVLREELDAKISELRNRLRVENRLDHEAQAAQALEKDGRWQEAEDTYRRMAAETTLQQRREELARAQERCQAERVVADLFDSGLSAYKTKDLVGAMNRLRRVIDQRPGYVRKGIVAEEVLAQARKEWELRYNQASTQGTRGFRLVLAGGFFLVILLVIGIWTSSNANLAPAKTAPVATTPTLVSPDAMPAQPVAVPSDVLPAQPVMPKWTPAPLNPPAQTGTAAAAKTATPTVSPRSP